MKLITLDFETYYSKEFSLTKMTTEAYIRNPMFEVIGFAYKVGDQEPVWVSGSYEHMRTVLAGLDLENSYMLAHNTAFDGAILAWHFGIRPKYYIDTLSMARPITGGTVGGSLAKLAQKFMLGEKGTEVVNALGKMQEDFSPSELAAYGEYCKNDVQICWNLYHILKQWNPPKEMFIQDLMLRMFIDPVLELDAAELSAHLENVQEKKHVLMARLDAAIGRDALMSNPKFAEVLIKLGVTPPQKVSLRTEKETFAFGKNDPEFKALLDHPDPRVQAVVSARLGIKSTLEETRTESFIGIAKRGTLPIMLNYWGAHTGRASGGDKMNLQNLPRSGALRRSIKAPKGHKVVACDSSQIEARVVAMLGGEQKLLTAFSQGEDIYSQFASDVYGRTVIKENKIERFVGKTCVSKGTLVLSNSGWKPIEAVTAEDKLWDGEEWVCHQGLVNNGIKPTLNLCGVWLTPDHQVWSGTQWLEAQSVVADVNILYRVLDTAAENLPLQATLLAPEKVSKHSSSDATAMKPNTWLATTASKILRVLGAIFAPKQQRLRNAIGCTATQWQMMSTGLAYSIASLQQLLDATRPQIERTNITENVVSTCVPNGGPIEPHFYSMYRLLTGGKNLILKWTELMWTKVMNREISASYRAAITSATSAKSQTLKPVFDILNCGSRNRFTILTEAGPAIVHNCILGLGFGMGYEKFRATLKQGMGGMALDISEDEARRIVQLYRNKFDRIADLWKQADTCLASMTRGFTTSFKDLSCDADGVYLPNGTMIRYANLRKEANQYVYDGRYGPVKIYGGKFVENVTQALAKIVVFDQMARIEQILRPMDTPEQRHRVVLTVHDEVVCVVPEDKAEWALGMMEEQMKRSPSWAKDLPISCEGGIGDSYGDAK